MERLQQIYNKEIVPALTKKYGYSNKMMVPRLKKVVVNVGVGKFIKDSKLIDAIVEDIKTITGQRPVKTIAKKSIAGFKIREGQVVGVTVTLRKDKMYVFLDKLINVALPRVRDFRGLAVKFDGRGNLSLGVKEHLVFPEISQDAIDNPFGVQMTIVTESQDGPARDILTHFKFPFKND